MTWDAALASYDEMVAAAHHVDMYWFPHTDRLMVKQNVRTDLDPGEQDPPSRLAAWWEDDLVSNTVFGALCRIGERAPGLVPRINRVAGRALSERRYSDLAHRVFVTPRRVRFREMEYAVPREVGLDVLRECRRVIDASDWRIAFPVEIRTARADDVPMSTAHGRDSFYLAFHVPARHRPHGLLRRPRADPPRGGRTSRTGARSTRARPPTWRRRTTASTTSSRCASASTRTGSSPTPTCDASSATEPPDRQAGRDQTLAGPLGSGARQPRTSASRRIPRQVAEPGRGHHHERQVGPVEQRPRPPHRRARGWRRGRPRRSPARCRRGRRGSCRRRCR